MHEWAVEEHQGNVRRGGLRAGDEDPDGILESLSCQLKGLTQDYTPLILIDPSPLSRPAMTRDRHGEQREGARGGGAKGGLAMTLLTLLMSAVDIFVMPTAIACSFPSANIAEGTKGRRDRGGTE